jgi:hypothetical protein
VLLSVGEAELDGIRGARAAVRATAWRAGAAPARVVLDFDATPVTAHSEKEHAAGHYKGGFGFHPLLVSCGREVLAGILRRAMPAPTTPTTTCRRWGWRSNSFRARRLTVTSWRARIPPARATTSRCCRETDIRFSLGYALTKRSGRRFWR